MDKNIDPNIVKKVHLKAFDEYMAAHEHIK